MRKHGQPPDATAFLLDMLKWKDEIGLGMPELIIPQWMGDLLEIEHGARVTKLAGHDIIEGETKLNSIALKHALDKSAKLS